MSDFKFKDKIKEIVSSFEYRYGREEYSENRARGEIDFTTETNMTFDLLSQISDIVGSRKINLHSETRYGGGCETCDFEYGVAEIHIWGVDFNAP